MTSTIKRPKSDGRCIHCREVLVKKTGDHVFPSSWYPDVTPPTIQRWKAPSCARCNGQFGAMEQDLLVKFGLCVDPRKAAASGISKKALSALGIGVSGLSEKEMQIRKARRDKILERAKPHDKAADGPHVIPGLGLHAGFPVERQAQIEIPADAVYAVAKKILRGCEYWLAEGRIVEPPYELEVFFPSKTPEQLEAHLKFGPDYLGPGCRIRRAVPVDEPGAAIYEIVIWDTLTLFCTILPPETFR
jgi:hypothetical protein